MGQTRGNYSNPTKKTAKRWMIKRFRCQHLGVTGSNILTHMELVKKLQGTRPQPLGSSETDHVCGVDRDVLGALADISTMGDMEAGYGRLWKQLSKLVTAGLQILLDFWRLFR